MKTFKLYTNHVLNRTLPSTAENKAFYERFYKKHWGHTDSYAVNWRGHPSWLAARFDLRKVKSTAWEIIDAVAREAGHCKQCEDYIDYDYQDETGWKEYALCRKCYRKHERDRKEYRGIFERTPKV